MVPVALLAYGRGGALQDLGSQLFVQMLWETVFGVTSLASYLPVGVRLQSWIDYATYRVLQLVLPRWKQRTASLHADCVFRRGEGGGARTF